MRREWQIVSHGEKSFQVFQQHVAAFPCLESRQDVSPGCEGTPGESPGALATSLRRCDYPATAGADDWSPQGTPGPLNFAATALGWRGHPHRARRRIVGQ